jgi:hypothetical protein
MARAWQVLDIVLVLITVACAAMMLDAATNLTSSGLTLVGLLIVSATPFLCAITARLIRALLAKQERPWRSLAAHRGMLLLHPLIVAAVFVFAYCFDWALATRFALSRLSLERAASAAASRPSDTRESARWIGLYRIEATRADPNGRVRLELGDCRMLATCDLELDPIADCASRGWREYRELNRRWCLVVHDPL